MDKPIRIYPGDSEEEVKARHEKIVARLEELGPKQVEMLMNTGGLPPQWNPIITGWVSGKAK